ncbi:Uma2 family endonuclease [Thermostichus vulcanus]|uniref:Uma2 family endonuclease n=1 Tax=Thermostichus vulcanus str. 'Rupite' TaxID=2813851 RepID=A0ABT0CB76_THEVL|nr:Uma2 family endonuclease [Thermostichus vulcanus]MCJ2543030.1 Uma2 family endonuclease [Thermostichus vulcanus str. 'Rupite']
MLSTPTRIPPLESGDHLSRAEFERRYEAMPDLKKAELVEGVVYMGSPLRVRSHGEPHANLLIWLGVYKISLPGLVLADNPTVRMDAKNELQPDIVLFVPGQQAMISEDDYIEGSPELIVEIAASSASLDLHEKKEVYRRNQVREYIVWRTLEGGLDWFTLQAGSYSSLEPDENGILKCATFPGLWLDRQALLNQQMTRVLEVLQQGIQSPEHSKFVQLVQQVPQEIKGEESNS